MFKNYVSEILHTEIAKVIEKQGYFIETEFCNLVCDKHDFSMPTVRGTLRRIYPELSLTKRRLSDELKNFYGLEIKGCPIVYISNR